jgi:hypothetical protein
MQTTFIAGTTNETSPPEYAGGRGLIADDGVACLDFVSSREATRYQKRIEGDSAGSAETIHSSRS